MASDERLQSLEQLFYFATARNLVHDRAMYTLNHHYFNQTSHIFINNNYCRDLTITANRQQKCILTIDPTPEPLVHKNSNNNANNLF